MWKSMDRIKPSQSRGPNSGRRGSGSQDRQPLLRTAIDETKMIGWVLKSGASYRSNASFGLDSTVSGSLPVAVLNVRNLKA